MKPAPTHRPALHCCPGPQTLRHFPPTHVFEGLRALVLHDTFRGDLMLAALVLNVGYFIAGLLVFRYFLQSARTNGSLVQMGE